MICLLEFSLTDFDDIAKILRNLIQKLPANVAFTMEQAVERVFVITALLLQAGELLSYGT